MYRKHTGSLFSKPGAYEATKTIKKDASQKIETDDSKMEVSYVVCVFVLCVCLSLSQSVSPSVHLPVCLSVHKFFARIHGMGNRL